MGGTDLAKRIGALALSVLALTSCQPGESGPLVPLPAVGLSIGQNGNQPVAQLSDPALSATIGGTWSTHGGTEVNITYSNTGTADTVIVPAMFMLRRDGRRFPPVAIVEDHLDMTAPGVHDTPPKQIYRDSDAPMAPSWTIPAGQSRKIAVQFDYPPDDALFEVGQTLTVDAPFPNGPRTVTFRTGKYGG